MWRTLPHPNIHYLPRCVINIPTSPHSVSINYKEINVPSTLC